MVASPALKWKTITNYFQVDSSMLSSVFVDFYLGKLSSNYNNTPDLAPDLKCTSFSTKISLHI